MDLVWNIALVLCAILFVAFTFVVAVGAPFLPTLQDKVPLAMEMINLKKGQTLLELGSGDGRVLKAAAKAGLKAVGYELNPLLVIYSRFSLWRYRKNVRVVWGNYWNATWPPADGIFVFLLQPYMAKLDKEIKERCNNKPVKLMSFAFTIPGKKPVKKKGGLYLYQYLPEQ